MQKTEINTASAFKQCSLCHTVWETKETFLNDPDIRLNGYQFTGRHYINSASGGMLVFTHLRATCGTTLAVYARTLKDVGEDPCYGDRNEQMILTGTNGKNLIQE